MLKIEGATGEFQEVDHGHYFTYRLTQDAWALQEGYTHEIDVLDGVRYGIVKKTVAYICVDENMTEKWFIRKHVIYQGE